MEKCSNTIHVSPNPLTHPNTPQTHHTNKHTHAHVHVHTHTHTHTPKHAPKTNKQANKQNKQKKPPRQRTWSMVQLFPTATPAMRYAWSSLHPVPTVHPAPSTDPYTVVGAPLCEPMRASGPMTDEPRILHRLVVGVTRGGGGLGLTKLDEGHTGGTCNGTQRSQYLSSLALSLSIDLSSSLDLSRSTSLDLDFSPYLLFPLSPFPSLPVCLP